MPAAECPVCSARADPWFELDRGVIFRCVDGSCGLGFLHPQPDDEQLSRFYREHYYPEHLGAVAYENSTVFKSQQHLEALQRRVDLRSGTMLDYGCGEGVFLELAGEHGYDVVGVEFDDVGRATAQGKGLRVEKTIDALDDRSIAFVYMNDVIEHLRDPVADLGEIRAKMLPGAQIFIVTMNMKGLTPRLQQGRWGVVTNPTHLWLYDETSLEHTLHAAGFGEVEVQRWPVQFDHHGLARRWAQRALQAAGLDASLRVLARNAAS